MPLASKGGEGKTTAVTGVIDYLDHNGLKYNLRDCDAENKGRGELGELFSVREEDRYSWQ